MAEEAIRRARWWLRVRGVVASRRERPCALYGPTALQALGVALPSRLEDWDACHLLVGEDTFRPAREHVVVHETRAPLTVWRRLSGVPVQHPVDHWLQLRGATADELIEVGDGLLRRGSPLLTLDEMSLRLGTLAGTAGVRRARRVMPWMRAGTDSLMETRTRLVLVRAGLPCPAVNLPVFCRGILYYLDMAYVAERLAVEYDGVYHVGNRQQMEADARRRRDLQDEGWMVITVTADQVRDPAGVVASVEQALRLRRTAVRSRGGPASW